MQKVVEASGSSEHQQRRVLARVVAEELQKVRGGGTADPLTIVQTGGAVRDLSETGSEWV